MKVVYYIAQHRVERPCANEDEAKSFCAYLINLWGIKGEIV